MCILKHTLRIIHTTLRILWRFSVGCSVCFVLYGMVLPTRSDKKKYSYCYYCLLFIYFVVKDIFIVLFNWVTDTIISISGISLLKYMCSVVFYSFSDIIIYLLIYSFIHWNYFCIQQFIQPFFDLDLFGVLCVCVFVRFVVYSCYFFICSLLFRLGVKNQMYISIYLPFFLLSDQMLFIHFFSSLALLFVAIPSCFLVFIKKNDYV